MKYMVKINWANKRVFIVPRLRKCLKKNKLLHRCYLLVDDCFTCEHFNGVVMENGKAYVLCTFPSFPEDIEGKSFKSSRELVNWVKREKQKGES